MTTTAAKPQFDVYTPCMNIYSPPGTRVVFLGINGYDGEKKAALALLDVGQVYIVKQTDVHSSSTTVWLKGFDRGFNSVMFGPESVLQSATPTAGRT
jgi:hypothetical protein